MAANDIFVDTDGDSNITTGTYDFEKDNQAIDPYANITDETGDGKLDINLTQAESLAIIDGAIFTDAINTGSGTGNYNTFLALSDLSGGEKPQDYYEQGFNSDDTNPLDGTNPEIDPSKTHTLLLGSVPITVINGIAYYEFRVDLNESNSSPDTNISLDQFKLFTSTNGNIQSTTDLFNAAVATKRYDMDGMNGEHDVSVLLSEANSSGSGNDDYAVLVPVSNFAGLNPTTTYLYLFVQMGAADGAAGSANSPWSTQGGFEEWNLQNALIVQGYKYRDVDGDGVKDPEDTGLAGVTIYIDDDLDGIAEATDGNGQLDAGEQSTITDANGYYAFGGIPILDNNYSFKIREVVPGAYFPTTQTSDQYGPYVLINVSSQDAAGSIITAAPLFNKPLLPHVTITKSAAADGNCADDVGEKITYTIVVDNDGDLSLTDVVVEDNFEGGGNVTLMVTGDTNNNQVLDVGEVWRSGDDGDGILETNETWTYTYVKEVTQDQIDSNGGDGELSNVATVNASSAGGSVTDSDDATVEVCQDPALAIDKQAKINEGDDCVDSVGDKVYYTYYVTNEGNVALSNVVVVDDKLGTLTLDSGDTDGDSLLDVGETWVYKASITADQSLIDAWGDGDGTIKNTATANGKAAVSGEAALEASDDESVDVCQSPAIDVEKSVKTDQEEYRDENSLNNDDDPDGLLASTSNTNTFKVVVTNTGNVTLSNLTFSDSVVHTVNGVATSQDISYFNDGDAGTLDASNVWVDLDNDGIRAGDGTEEWDAVDGADGAVDGVLGSVELGVDKTITVYYDLESQLGQHENTATVTGYIGQTGVSDFDDANYYVLPSEDCVGVGTPGFWGINGAVFWDGTADNEAKAGQPGFADGELVYAVDSNNDGYVNAVAGDGINDAYALDSKGLLIGDWDHDGLNDEGNAIFVSLADAKALINASQKQLQDGKYLLGRDMVATWLNYLANGGSQGDTSCVDRPGTTDDAYSPMHYLNEAIDWMQTFAGTTNDGSAEAFDVFKINGPVVKTNDGKWQTAQDGVDFSAAQMHSALDLYNNTGTINGVVFCCDRDNADAMFAIQQLTSTL